MSPSMTQINLSWNGILETWQVSWAMKTSVEAREQAVLGGPGDVPVFLQGALFSLQTHLQ